MQHFTVGMSDTGSARHIPSKHTAQHFERGRFAQDLVNTTCQGMLVSSRVTRSDAAATAAATTAAAAAASGAYCSGAGLVGYIYMRACNERQRGLLLLRAGTISWNHWHC